MRIEYGRKFLKEYEKIPLKIKQAFAVRRQLFTADPFHPLLQNHSLTGEWLGFRSINITGDWRAIYKQMNEGDRIIFAAIGTHSKLYGK